MQFSIRQILFFMVAVALTVLTCSKYVERSAMLKELDQLRVEIESAKASQLACESLIPFLDDDLARPSEIQQAVETAMASFVELQARYGHLKIADENAFSIIRQPTVALKEHGTHLSKWRLFVPENRAIYLKLGVQETDPHRGFVFEPITSASKFLDKSHFEPTGPFEKRLPGGQHVLTAKWDKSGKSQFFEFELLLDEQKLVSARFDQAPISGCNTSSVVFKVQQDYPATKKLPILLSLKPVPAEPGQISPKPGDHPQNIVVWLADHSSHFAPMTGGELSDE